MKPHIKNILTLVRSKNIVGVLAVIILMFAGLMIVANAHQEYIISTALKYPGIDKVAHFMAHFSLVMLLYVVFHRKWEKMTFSQRLVLIFLISFIVGVTDELQQHLFSARGFDFFDLLANLSGAASAIILITALYKKSLHPALMLMVPAAVMLFVFQTSTDIYKHYNMGLVHIKNKDFVEARSAFLSAIDNGVEFPSLFNELAWIELEHIDTDPATSLSYTKRAVKAQPNNADFLDTHGWALHRNGDNQQALIYLKKAHALNKEIYCINYHLGATYFALGRYADSLTYLQAQLEINETDSFAKRSLALLEMIKQEGSSLPELTQLLD